MGSGTSPQHVSIPLNVNQDSPPPKHFKRSRRRRSVESNEMESEEDPQLYDQVMSSLKGLIFGKENPIEASNTYDDLHRRVKDLRYQLGEPKFSPISV